MFSIIYHWFSSFGRMCYNNGGAGMRQMCKTNCSSKILDCCKSSVYIIPQLGLILTCFFFLMDSFIFNRFCQYFTLQNKGKYEIIVGTPKSADEMVDMYLDLVKKFPSILTLIDPLRKEVSSFYLYIDIFKFALLFKNSI